MIAADIPLAAGGLATAGRAVRAASDAEQAAAALATLGEALRAAGDACDALAEQVIPVDVAGPVCERYAAAAGRWPAPRRPSHEQLAAILAGLHDAAASARLAGRRCDRAVGAVAATAGARDAAR